MAGFTDPEITFLLEDEREADRRFVAEAASEPDFPRGWSGALLMAHIASWRTRLRDCLIEASRGLPVSGPPSDIDAYNAAERPATRGSRSKRRPVKRTRGSATCWISGRRSETGRSPGSPRRPPARPSFATATFIRGAISPSTMWNAATEHAALKSRTRRWPHFAGSARRAAS